MKLKVSYDQEFGIFWIRSDQRSGMSTSLITDVNLVIDMPSEQSCQVVGLEVHGIEAYLPLGKLSYCTETDTLTFGSEVETATVAEENGDFVGYWRPDEDYPDDAMEAVAVDLRNASKHLAPVIAALPGTLNIIRT